MECGFIKKIIATIIICSSLLCGCEKNEQPLTINKYARNYVDSQQLDKCSIKELYNYDAGDSLIKIINNSKFEIDEEQVSNYAVHIVDNYEYIAYIYGVSLEEYYSKNMKLTKEQFYEKCYTEGVNDMKNIYTVGAIAQNEKISVSNKEYNSYVKQHDYDIKIDGSEKDRIKFLILEKKLKHF